jgi:undecaprenyl-diphosphatase
MIQTWAATLDRWDQAFCLFIFNWNGKRLLDRAMVWLSKIGDGMIYPIVCLAVLMVDPGTGKRMLPSVMAAFLIELSLQKGIKRMIRRPRPFMTIPGIRNLVKPPDDFSFPSGHTASAFLMSLILGHFYPLALIPCILLAGVIGLSRIYNGVHYPGDVLAGMLLGILSATAGLKLL